MTNNDNTFDMSKLELLFREHFARSDKQLADIRADNAEFKVQIKNELSNFKSEVNSRLDSLHSEINKRFDGLYSEINSRFDKLQTKVEVMQNDITGLKHDVANLQHWNYWILAIILAVFVLPHFASGVKAFFGTIRNGITSIIAMFKVKQ